MKRVMAVVLSMTLVGSVIAAQAQNTTTPTTTTTKTRKKTAPKKAGPTVSEQLGELKLAIEAQQQQIRQLGDQVQTRVLSYQGPFGVAAPGSESINGRAGANQGGRCRTASGRAAANRCRY